jgi:hypothetical protein
MSPRYIKPKRHIVWSTNKEIDIENLFLKKWYITQVLVNGRAEDISELDWNEIKNLLPELEVPPIIKKLWEDYFNANK